MSGVKDKNIASLKFYCHFSMAFYIKRKKVNGKEVKN
jgi:hypothetical protein